MAGTGTAHLRDDDDVLLRIADVSVEYRSRRRVLNAVGGLNLDVKRGETLGLVGESGCGKSTTGRAIVQLPRPTSGRVWFDDIELTALSGEELRRVRPRLQMIYQDPIASLNPRRTVGEILAEPLVVWRDLDRAQRRQLVDEVLDVVGLDPNVARHKRAQEFSGGQCQRICIARALILKPEMLLCDEPVSALDVSVQAQILNLLKDLKDEYELTMVFIAHDLAVVKNISDRVAVMYVGKLCEVGSADAVYRRPAHPYTVALLSAVPIPDPDSRSEIATTEAEEPPTPQHTQKGCPFRQRCPRAGAICRDVEPEIRRVDGGDHFVACHFPIVEVAR
ncbi:MAG TPA: oligopeptide/dipeptide ABC transporter ATP-binding protein [Ilumatobacter sp.]|nr:oligopeptide/dipeptide ABC transporter ATP-binding protein [Ilumatobacter sp.]